jgi:hypothetical protein
MALISYKEWASGEEEVSCDCKVSLRGNSLFFENDNGNFDLELQPEQIDDVKQKMVSLQTANSEDDMAEPQEGPATPDGQPPMVKGPMAQ